MKIACVATSLVPSTTANSIQLMKACHALAQNGHDVRLWVPGEAETPWDDLSSHYGIDHKFPITWVKSQKIFKRYDFACYAWQQIRAWQPDLIYTWFIPLAAWMLEKNTPVILEMHDLPSGFMGRRLFQRWIESGGKKRTLFITQALKEMIEAVYRCHFTTDECVIAPNGVDISRYQDLPSAAQARHLLELPEKTTVVYSGHFYPGRGMDLLCDLALAFPELHFLWIGGSIERVAFWKERLHHLGIENVTLSGFIPNERLPLYQAAGDILLMPYETAISGSSGGNSVKICSPMKMFDYLASGRVILTSDIPVFHEVLNERNAIFCPPNDLEAWRSAILQIIQDHTLMERFSCQSRKDAAQYSWQERARRALVNFNDN